MYKINQNPGQLIVEACALRIAKDAVANGWNASDIEKAIHEQHDSWGGNGDDHFCTYDELAEVVAAFLIHERLGNIKL